MKGKQGIAGIIWVAVFAVILIAGATYTGFNLGSITGSGEYIERPVFKYVKCEPTSSLKISEKMSVDASGTWLTKPSASDKYDVVVFIPAKKPFLLVIQRVEYSVCNSKSASQSNCRLFNQRIEMTNDYEGTLEIQNVKPEEYVFVKYLGGLISYSGKSGASYQISYIPYGLREYNPLGGYNEINPQDCTSSFSDPTYTDRLLSTDSSKVQNVLQKNKVSYERTLKPNEVRNFVSGYLTSASPSFALTYKGQEAWCKPDSGKAIIYKINKVVLGSGTYKVASTDYNDILGTEICCNGDKQADKACENFKWVSTASAQCSAFNPCDGGTETPISSGLVGRYACENSRCVLKTRAVACASDADCSDLNKVCSRSTWSCVQANVNLNGQVIKTQPDNSEDCKAIGGRWITESSSKKSLLNMLGFGEPEIIVKNYCDTSSWWQRISWTWLIVLVLLGGFIYMFRAQIPAWYKSTIGRLTG